MTDSRIPRYQELNPDISSDYLSLAEQAHAFAEDVMRPTAAVLDGMSPEEVISEQSPLWAAFHKWFQAGHHAMLIPEEFGGANLDATAQALVTEEFGWGAPDLAVSLGVASIPFVFAAHMARLTGNKRLIDEIVAPFVADTEGHHIGCWAITEPGHGSDELAAGIDSFQEKDTAGSCRAYQDGDEWVITGQKSAWVSNGTIATHALLFCTVDASKGMAGGAVAVVPLDRPGVTKGPPLNKLGQRSLNQGEIFFDGARIPSEYILVGPDFYKELLDLTLVTANSGMSLIFTGLARAAFEEALEYSKIRVQGGKAISEHQLVQGMIFDMFARVEQSRAFARAALYYNNASPSVPFAITAKVTATQTAFDVASRAIQVFGGMGLSKGTLVEKLIRDARSSTIEDGVNEFLGLVAARRIIDGYGVPNAMSLPISLAG